MVSLFNLYYMTISTFFFLFLLNASTITSFSAYLDCTEANSSFALISSTGESEAVIKETKPVDKNADIEGKTCMVFAGTTVVNGNCICLVTDTGIDTQIGRVHSQIQEEDTPPKKKLSYSALLLRAFLAEGFLARDMITTRKATVMRDGNSGRVHSQIQEAAQHEEDTPMKKKINELVWLINVKYFLSWTNIDYWTRNFEFFFEKGTYYFETALVITAYLAVESMNVQLLRRIIRGSSRALLCLLLVVSCTAIGPSNITTIHSPDGDILDCINIKDQPTFKDPLLKHHKLQEKPTDMLPIDEEYGWQVWHASGVKCPHGTIPIRRSQTRVSREKRDGGFVPDAPSRATPEHQYAVAYVDNLARIYGTRATISVWDPIVEAPDDFSIAQVWLLSGHYATSDINSIEAGWQVFPGRYGDRQPRLFTYWTRDGYLYTGCYSLHCSGFVQTSKATALEAAITPISKFGGDQFAITIQIWKDRLTRNWWLGVNGRPVGYWPAKIFTSLSDHADFVEWGGEVLYRNSSGMSPKNQMGSGEFAEKGFREAAYVSYLEIAEKNFTFLPVQEFDVIATHPKSYRVMKSFTEGFGHHFYFGGPGPRLERSAAVPGGLPSFLFLFYAFYLVV